MGPPGLAYKKTKKNGQETAWLNDETACGASPDAFGTTSTNGQSECAEKATIMPEVIINAPAGRIEGRYNHAKTPNAPAALLLHPHPQHGGTMNNKVVYTLFQAFAKRGWSALRFNFRGVGRSQGTYDRGEGELGDAAAALDWLQTYNPNASSCWIGGFSFGAWIGMQLLMRRPEIDGFVSVAPPANMFDFSFLAPCPSSGLIVHGSRDELVPEAHVAKLVQKLSNQRDIKITYRIVEGANHLFHDRSDALAQVIDDYLEGVLGAPVAAVAE
jgi:alpha/beta superfamily hydrolase